MSDLIQSVKVEVQKLFTNILQEVTLMNEVICPLLTTNTVVDANHQIKIGTQPVLCVREQCAWWLEDKQKCAIAVMGGKK